MVSIKDRVTISILYYDFIILQFLNLYTLIFTIHK